MSSSNSNQPPEPGKVLAFPRVYEPLHGCRVGRVVGLDAVGLPLVDFEANPTGAPLAAQVAMALDTQALLAAMRSAQPALLVFLEGDPLRPVLLGLLRPPQVAPLTQVVLDAATRAEGLPGPAQQLEAVKLIDGELFITAPNGITLRCGEASLTLLPDGTVRTRGARIESRADGLHLVRGGKVEIN